MIGKKILENKGLIFIVLFFVAFIGLIQLTNSKFPSKEIVTLSSKVENTNFINLELVDINVQDIQKLNDEYIITVIENGTNKEFSLIEKLAEKDIEKLETIKNFKAEKRISNENGLKIEEISKINI